MESVVTEYMNNCLLCGRPTIDKHHLLFGRGIRPLADDDKLIIPVCRECHNLIHSDPRVGNLSKILGQIVWEKTNDGDRESFIRRYGKSYT